METSDPEENFTGYYVKLNGYHWMARADNHILMDGHLTILRDGKEVAGFPSGEWSAFVFLGDFETYNRYKKLFAGSTDKEECTPKRDPLPKGWWKFWK